MHPLRDLSGLCQWKLRMQLTVTLKELRQKGTIQGELILQFPFSRVIIHGKIMTQLCFSIRADHLNQKQFFMPFSAQLFNEAYVHWEICTICFLTGVVIDCGSLDDQENGLVHLTGTTVGAVATYTCFLGYLVASGDAVRNCQSNGQWSGVAVVCKGKSSL